MQYDDWTYERIARLSDRRERERSDCYFVEGLRFLVEASATHAPIECLVTSPPLLTHPQGLALARYLRGRGTPVLELPPDRFLRIARSEEPQGIGAVVRQRWTRLDAIRPGRELCWLALETINSPGNLGTMLRTCDATGAAGVILLGPATDPFDPACVRATMGAIFSTKLVRASHAEMAAWKRRHGWLIAGTSSRAERDYRALHVRRPLVLMLGCEREGLSEEQRELCDTLVRIPMVGRASSLNVAVATGVLLYELLRRRCPPGGPEREGIARRPAKECARVASR